MINTVRMLDFSDGYAVHRNALSMLVRDSEPNLTPLVTIAIPTYKRPALLRESVKSALAQTTKIQFEVVVVDNNSDHQMAKEVDAIIASFNAPNLRLFRNKTNLGMFGNWNRCIELARGRWITILNDDDLLNPSFLEETLKIVTEHNSILMVGCKIKTLDARLNRKPASLLGQLRLSFKYVLKVFLSNKPRQLTISDYFLSNRHHGTLGILMDRKSAISLGGFSQTFYPSSDFIFIARFALSHTVYFLPTPLATCRIGVNESLKPELCIGWMKQGIQLREELIPYLNASSWLLRQYARLCAINSAYSYRDLWNPDFDVMKTLKEEGFSFRPAWPVFILMLLTRSFLYITFSLTQLTSSKQLK